MVGTWNDRQTKTKVIRFYDFCSLCLLYGGTARRDGTDTTEDELTVTMTGAQLQLVQLVQIHLPTGANAM